MAIFRKRRAKLIQGFIAGIIMLGLISGLMFMLGYGTGKRMQDTEERKSQTDEEFKRVFQLNKSKKVSEFIGSEDITTVHIPINQAPMEEISEADLIGKVLKIDVPKNGILLKEFVADEIIQKDLRLHIYSFIKLHDKLVTDDFVDIRISFANGSDFIILPKKKIIDLTLYNLEQGIDNTLWIEVNEEEILRMSSAAVDAYLNENCYIYAIKYIESSQEASIGNYPVNETVQELIESNPNIIDKAYESLSDNLRRELVDSEVKSKPVMNEEEGKQEAERKIYNQGMLSENISDENISNEDISNEYILNENMPNENMQNNNNFNEDLWNQTLDITESYEIEYLD